MAWSRFDDSWSDHPKVIAAGNEAVGVFTRAVAWSAKHLTDGLVPVQIVTMIAGGKRAKRVIEQLVKVGLFDAFTDESIRIHDFLDYNLSRAQVLDDREELRRVRAESGRRGGLRSGEVRRSKPEANRKQVASSFASDTSKQNGSPDPTRPVELQNPSCILPLPSGNGSRAPRAPTVPRLRPWPEDLKLTDKHRAFAEQGGLDAGMEWGAFKDHHLAKGSRFADWDRAWQTWCRNAFRFAAERLAGRH